MNTASDRGPLSDVSVGRVARTDTPRPIHSDNSLHTLILCCRQHPSAPDLNAGRLVIGLK